MMLDAPFPWFGGKRRVAAEVWSRFGGVINYVEPFFGSGAVLLGRPEPFDGPETVNDLDGFVANFWRAIKTQPEETARWADNPVNENDLHARHAWLVERRDSLRARLEGNPDWCDPRIAGYWVWGLCCWIGSGWCSGNGPWNVVDGQLVHLGNAGRGVNRQRVHLGNAGRGVNRQRVHLSGAGLGVNRKHNGIAEWFDALSARLRNVRVCSGDWARVCGPSATYKSGLTAVFLDPPYTDAANRCDGLYAADSLSVGHAVRDWAIEAGENPQLRIALCGYEGEYEMPPSWSAHEWKTQGGYECQAKEQSGNRRKERIWFSPHCLAAQQQDLFGR